MKKLLIMSIALVAIMATVFTVSAFAANTVEIGNVTIARYYDTVEVEGVTTDVYNDAYAVVTVPYTVTGDVDRLTFYLAAQDLSAALEGEEAKVIYIDETVNPDAASFTFVIEKARVRTALIAAEEVDSTITKDKANAAVEGLALTFKLGGTDVDVAASKTVVYNNPTIYGDANCNGRIQANDATPILRYSAELMELPSKNLITADANGNGMVQSNDATPVLRISAELFTYEQLLSARKFSY